MLVYQRVIPTKITVKLWNPSFLMSSELPSWVVPAAAPWLGPRRPPSPGPGRAWAVVFFHFLRWKTMENPWKIMAKTRGHQGKSGKIHGKSGKTEWVDGKTHRIYMSLAMKYIGFSCKIVPKKTIQWRTCLETQKVRRVFTSKNMKHKL